MTHIPLRLPTVCNWQMFLKKSALQLQIDDLLILFIWNCQSLRAVGIKNKFELCGIWSIKPKSNDLLIRLTEDLGIGVSHWIQESISVQLSQKSVTLWSKENHPRELLVALVLLKPGVHPHFRWYPKEMVLKHLRDHRACYQFVDGKPRPCSKGLDFGNADQAII